MYSANCSADVAVVDTNNERCYHVSAACGTHSHVRSSSWSSWPLAEFVWMPPLAAAAAAEGRAVQWSESERVACSSHCDRQTVSVLLSGSSIVAYRRGGGGGGGTSRPAACSAVCSDQQQHEQAISVMRVCARVSVRSIYTSRRRLTTVVCRVHSTASAHASSRPTTSARYEMAAAACTKSNYVVC